ncbi:MAG: DotI/IcmL family type IV secretion protein [Deltaproteobacteria bacterium]|nr:DotI/IcmL family type IV secretion protein [Deltaproteobacteria bacterium]
MTLGGISSLRRENRRLAVLLKWLVPSLTAVIVLLGALAFRGSRPVYFAVSPDMRLTELVPVDRPNISQQALVNWATETVTRVTSLNFLDWERSLADIRSDFEPAAFASFVESLKTGGHISMIQSQRLNVSAVPDGAAFVEEEKIEGGRMTWHITVPVAVSYQSSVGVLSTKRYVAEVDCARVPEYRNPKGVVVTKLILARGT